MPTPLGTVIKAATSPAGRRALRYAVRVARTEEGRKLVAQAGKVVRSPEGRKLINQVTALVKQPAETWQAAGHRLVPASSIEVESVEYVDALTQVYPVATGAGVSLPVRVTTLSADIPTATGVFRVEQYDNAGTRVAEATLRTAVAG